MSFRKRLTCISYMYTQNRKPSYRIDLNFDVLVIVQMVIYQESHKLLLLAFAFIFHVSVDIVCNISNTVKL